MTVLEKIIWTPLGDAHFMKEETAKHQIYVHHTASSPDPYGVLDWWRHTPERVATAFVIAGRPAGGNARWKDGDIVQCFSSKHWAWHLGLKASHLAKGGKTSTWLNQMSVGIEICSWGQLTEKSTGFYSYAGTRVADVDVCELSVPFRGYKFYQKYTEAQLDNTRELLLYLGQTWDIDLKYKGDEIFDIDKRALMGERGIWAHSSVRKDKFDVYPYPPLINMLKSL